MIFLIEYDRTAGVVKRMNAFADAERLDAEEARLKIELQLNREGVSREVVLLEAPTEEALHATHRRYFETLFRIVQSSATSTG